MTNRHNRMANNDRYVLDYRQVHDNSSFQRFRQSSYPWYRDNNSGPCLDYGYRRSWCRPNNNNPAASVILDKYFLSTIWSSCTWAAPLAWCVRKRRQLERFEHLQYFIWAFSNVRVKSHIIIYITMFYRASACNHRAWKVRSVTQRKNEKSYECCQSVCAPAE